MRVVFQAQLDQLTAELGEMCATAAGVMKRATTALTRGDIDAAEQVSADLARLDRLHDHVCDRALSLLALQAPVARDLRRVVAAIQIAANAHRMGGLAAKIAAAAPGGARSGSVPAPTLAHFATMGRVAVNLAERVQSAIDTGDVTDIERIQVDDDVMDDLHRQLFTVVTDPGWVNGAARAAEVVLLGRFYERYADHAVEIAQRLIFENTGVHHGRRGPSLSAAV